MTSRSTRKSLWNKIVAPPMTLVLVAAGLLTLVVVEPAAAAPCDEPVVNEIACENTRPGNPAVEWDIDGAGSSSIQGFATDISVAQGATVDFKIDTTASSYRLDVYRMGFYGGDGARLIASVNPTNVTNQPNCVNEPSTGLVDCGNWSVSASWAVPSDAVSGIYFAKLVRTDGPTGASHVFFVVRDDDGGSDLLFQTADTTWQAYNRYGGNSLYTGSPAGRAYKVSYNRPFTTRDYAPEDWVFNAEYPMVRHLEANGYDVSYTTGVDTDRFGAELLEHKVFVSVGHDEYWSGQQRANVEAARDAGVNLAFFSGNEVFWKTRWETSIDGSGQPHRTLVAYKETLAGGIIDPATPTWTGTWRDARFSPPADGGRPENELTGQMFRVNCCEIDMEVNAADGAMRFWRNSRVATLTGNQTTTIGSGIVGYEWDEDPDNGFRPPGTFRVSETSASGLNVLLDEGSAYGTGSATHSMTMYRAPSGALVFGAGTVQWAWGLDSNHDRGSAPADDAARQATVNLFADMGVQPSTLQAGLVPATISTDTTGPTVSVTSPTDGSTVNSFATVDVTGTAADVGGRVGGVEVSSDGGTTWRRANGRASWTYSFTAPASGSISIRARAVDDSGNIGAASQAITVAVGGSGSCPCSIWPSSAVPDRVELDTNSVEIGVKFQAAQDGYITGIRFYKFSQNTGTHVGHLWSSSGNSLGTVTFTGETATGWQQATFADPIPVTAGTTYVASYHAPDGYYAVNSNFFSGSGVTNGPLTALQSGVDGGNGVYAYGPAPGLFPSNTYQNENYWVDVVFDPSATDTTPPTVTTRTPAADASGVPATTAISATFSEAVTAATIGLTGPAGAVTGTTSYDAGSRTVTFTPSTSLSNDTSYTVDVSGATDTAGNTMQPTSWTFAVGGSGSCPCSIWPSSAVPDRVELDTNSVEIGVKFQAAQDGYITGIRFYKFSQNTGTHVGHLWSSSGNSLGTVTFTGETATGWQQATFADPIPVTAGTTYVASYHAPDGYYAVNSNFFSGSGVTNGPLTALQSGVDGGNGVYAYGPAPGLFPSNTYQNENYWVDVVFDPSATDTTPPTVTTRTPAADASGVPATTAISATFSEAVTAATIGLTGPAGAVTGTTSYDAGSRTVTFTPSTSLSNDTSYTVDVSGATDTAGNTMQPTSWTFTTSGPPPPLPTEGPGGPIGVVTSGVNPFSGYFAEILRSEGLNEFETFDVAQLNAAKLASFTTLVIGAVALSTAQVGDLTAWVNSGGNLIASRPDPQLASLLGLTPDTGTQSEGYLQVDTTTEPGAGIVGETIQFHGTADRYALAGASAVAMLYSSPTTATSNPAVTIRNVGSNGGQAAAFTYDLARSIVYTRQGNPTWVGQNRDGILDNIIRSNDLYFGGSQADWVNLNKVAIPQADEQQRLLANLIQVVNRDIHPLPRFWYFPDDHKAVVIATGDDHANGGTSPRFDAYQAASPPGCSVADWECYRFTSYVYPSVPMTDSNVLAYQQAGFEVAPHPQNGCTNFSSLQSLRSTYTSELAAFAGSFPSAQPPVTSRFHCLVWSDWDSQAVVSAENGIRFDVNYYYWPGSWINDRPGFMTGSGMPQRFARTDGTLIDVYQGATQMTDESGQSYPFTPDTLLDRAIGTEGYYGYFVANMHTDLPATQQDSALLSSATTRGVPVVTARQVLEFIDGRNASAYRNISWSANTLSFDISVGAGANNLTAMVPISGPQGTTLTGVTRGASTVSYQAWTVKGLSYAVFPAAAGSYAVTYGVVADSTPPSVTGSSPVGGATGVGVSSVVSATFSEGVSESSIVMSLTPAGGSPVAAATSYDSGSRTVTLTPSAALAGSTTYTVNLSGATDPAGNTMTPVSWSFTTAAPGPPGQSIWSSSTVPPTPSSGDTGSVELGLKFQASQSGFVTGVRFYKGSGNPGVHVGNLWTATGTNLGSVTFTGETASGWQQASFASPIAVSAGTTYVVSYHAPNGGYAFENNGLATSVVNGPLTALAAGPSGGNGVYLYGSGGFPSNSYQASNYFVDVVFTSNQGADSTPPSVTGSSPVGGATGVGVSSVVSATFSEGVSESSIVMSLTPAGGSPVAATTSYDSGSRTVTLTPSAALAGSTTYTVNLSGATDPAGNTMTPVSWSFTTAAPGPPGQSIWSSSTVPPTPSSGDTGSVELGLKFQASQSGFVTGVRFYKGSGNTGVHVGNLWTATGTNLGSVTFTGETASGWQQASFASPIAVSAGTTYVVSYHAPNGGYAFENNGLATSVVNGPLTALAAGPSGGNGVYLYGSGGFPSNSYQASNYFVDVVFTTNQP